MYVILKSVTNMFLPKRPAFSAVSSMATLSKTRAHSKIRYIRQRLSSNVGAFRSRITATATVVGVLAVVTEIASFYAPSHPVPTWNSLLPLSGTSDKIKQLEFYTNALNKVTSNPFNGNTTEAASVLCELAQAIATQFPEAAAHLVDTDSALRRVEKGAILGTRVEDKVVDIFHQTYQRIQQISNQGKRDTNDESFMAVWSIVIEMDNSLFVLLSKANRERLKQQSDQLSRIGQARLELDRLTLRLGDLLATSRRMPGTLCTFQQQQSYIQKVLFELRGLESET